MPDKVAVAGLVDGRVILQLDEAWPAAGASFKAGALAQLDLAALQADPAHPKPSLIWSPGPRDALNGIATTRDKLADPQGVVWETFLTNGEGTVYGGGPALASLAPTSGMCCPPAVAA